MRCLKMCWLSCLGKKNSSEGTRLSNAIQFFTEHSKETSMGQDMENKLHGAYQRAG